MRVSGGGRCVKTYSCHRNHQRGSTVCPITIHQPIEEVEGLLLDHLRDHVLNDEMTALVLDEIRAEIEAQLPQREADLAALEAELSAVTTEQKRLARAVAMSDEIPELMTELKQRMNRTKNLEAQIAAARRTPAELAALIDEVEASVKERLVDVRAALADRRDLRELLLGLFPRGLTFSPARTPDKSRAVWKLSGPAVYKVLGKRTPSGTPSRGGASNSNGSGGLDEPAEPALSKPRRDPNGTRCNRDRERPGQYSRWRVRFVIAAGSAAEKLGSRRENRSRLQLYDL